MIAGAVRSGFDLFDAGGDFLEAFPRWHKANLPIKATLMLVIDHRGRMHRLRANEDVSARVAELQAIAARSTEMRNWGSATS